MLPRRKHTSTRRLLLGYGRASVDELIDDGLTHDELEAWMHRFTDNAAETLKGAMIDAYAVIDGRIVAANPWEGDDSYD